MEGASSAVHRGGVQTVQLELPALESGCSKLGAFRCGIYLKKLFDSTSLDITPQTTLGEGGRLSAAEVFSLAP